MQLTKLEISGFKSFAKKTELIFKNGITGILGPNGCGKSNIADAFRFVLGEQNARALRGKRIDDFIFGGTEKRKPLSYCLLLRFPRLLLHAAPSVREKANTASTKPLHVCAIFASFSVTQASARTDIPSSDRAA